MLFPCAIHFGASLHRVACRLGMPFVPFLYGKIGLQPQLDSGDVRHHDLEEAQEHDECDVIVMSHFWG